MEAGETERALEQVAMAPIMPPPRPQRTSIEVETSVYHDQMEDFMAQEAGEEDVRFRRRSFGDLESFGDFDPSRPYAVPFPDERLAHTGVHPRYFPEMRQDLRRWGEIKSRGAPPELVADANFPDEDDEEEEVFSPPTTSVTNFLTSVTK